MIRNTLRRLLRNMLIGAGSIFDLCPASRRKLELPRIKTDEEALASDWQAVGDDMRAATKEIDDA